MCIKCNPGVMKKGELEEIGQGAQILYVEETSRSIQERAGEQPGGAIKRAT